MRTYRPFPSIVLLLVFGFPCLAEAAISFVNKGTPVFASGNGDLTPALPAGVQAGDLLLCVARHRGGTADPAISGWTELAKVSNAAHRLTLFGKIAGASESSPTVNFTGTNSTHTTGAQIAAFRGTSTDLGTIVAGVSSITTGNTNQNVPYPALTIATPNTLVLVIGGKNVDWDSVATLSGMTEIGEGSSSVNAPQGIVWDYAIQTTPASISAGQFTVTGPGAGWADISHALTVSLKPAASSGPITFVNKGTASYAASNGDLTPALPTGIQQGDLLLCFARHRGGTADPTIAGWTELATSSNGAHRTVLFGKIAGASESAPTVDFTGTTIGHTTGAQIAAFRGTSTTLSSIVAHEASVVTGNANQNIPYPMLPVTTPDTLVLVLGGKNVRWDSVATIAGMTEIDESTTTINATQGMVWDYVVQTTPATIAAGQFTVTGLGAGEPDISNAVAVSLRPAGSGGGDPPGGRPPATITVCASGCDHQTMAPAIQAAAAGDIIELRKVAGDDGIWNDRINFVGKNGTADAPITVRVQDDHSITLRAELPGNPADTDSFATQCTYATLCINNSHHIIIEGNSTGRTGLKINDPNDWNPNGDWQDYASAYAIKVGNAANTIALRNLTVAGAREWTGSFIHRDVDHVLIENVAFTGPQGWVDASVDEADVVEIQSSHTLMVDSLCQYGGHETCSIRSPWIIIRNSIFDGSWGSLSPGFGTRGFQLTAAENEKWRPTSTQPGVFGPQLLQHSTIRNTSLGGPNETQPCFKSIQLSGILRENMIHDCEGPAISLPGYVSISTSSHAVGFLHAYQNTSYNTWSALYANEAPPPESSCTANMVHNMSRNQIKNNVFQQLVTSETPTAVPAVSWESRYCGLGGYANGWRDSVLTSNIFGGPTSAMTISLYGPGLITHSDVPDPTPWSSNVTKNLEEDLVFVNPSNRQTNPFTALALSSSNAVGNGDAVHLTTVSAAGSGNSFTLADARYFHDGWDIDFSPLGEEFETVLGDWIAVTPTSDPLNDIGDAVCTRITSVDYATGVVVVSPGVTRVAGSKVWWGGDAATCAKRANRGAAQ